MINITDKHKCCGCSACEQVCPVSCITMKADNEGFRYPAVDLDTCIDCHACERVCPELAQSSERLPLKTMTTFNPDLNVRRNSSSGGIFSMLAEAVLDEGGIVFGVSFSQDFKSVSTTGIENKEDISRLRGSKYLQANPCDSFSEAAEALKADRKTLFSGTPCQIHGLNNYLKRRHIPTDNLTTIELICHGVPSEKTWQQYLHQEFGDSQITDVSFRDKTKAGWRNYYVTVRTKDRTVTQPHWQNTYMRAFLNNLSIRPSCYDCPSRNGRSEADIMLGDNWGEKSPDGIQNGISLVMAYSEKGKLLLDSLAITGSALPYETACRNNPSISHSATEPEHRELFWDNYRSDFNNAVRKAIPQAKLLTRIKRKIKSLILRKA